MKTKVLVFLYLLVSVTIISCSRDTEPSTARLQVRLTDDPADYDKVNIDIRDVQINETGENDKGWKSLAGVKPGVYNLLDLVNDKDTLLADAEIPSGRIHQIRLVLGENNSIEWNGQTIPLQTPSAQQSGLKLNIQQDVTGGVLYTLLMDFDAGRSIVQSGNESLILKPVIRTMLKAAGGSIRGVVSPKELHTAIFAIQGTDTVAGTFTDATGGFLIRALNAGTYRVAAVPLDPAFESKSIDAVNVSDGNVTTVDTLSFQ
ncbi:MAG TPA: DUF4382 domain-containing protein [Flavitalea sp.]|nr:DUF4382 domain-containing protein [Flavitalea sp.]